MTIYAKQICVNPECHFEQRAPRRALGYRCPKCGRQMNETGQKPTKKPAGEKDDETVFE